MVVNPLLRAKQLLLARRAIARRSRALAIGAAAAVAAVGLTVSAPSALAQSSRADGVWKTAQQVANEVYANDLTWGDGTVYTVEYTSCSGIGLRYGYRFQYFKCYVETDDVDPFWIRVVAGRGSSNSWSFLYYA